VRGIGKTLLNIDKKEDETEEPLQIEAVRTFKSLNYFK